MKLKSTGFSVTLAAVLLTGCASTDNTQSSSVKNSDMGLCGGINSCKGTGSCATANNNCAGQNTCKGKGWLPLTEPKCLARGGHFSGFNN